MSYQGEDKWECYIGEVCSSARTLKELKKKIEDDIIQNSNLNQAISTIRSKDYKICNVKISIRKDE